MKRCKKWLEWGEYSVLFENPFKSFFTILNKKRLVGEYPKLLNFFITWKCNSRCRLCNIWKLKDKTEIPLKKVSEIFSQKTLKKLKLVKISGGEPTLHSNFLDIIKIIKSSLPKTLIVVSTNGFPFQRVKGIIEKSIEIDPEIIFSISIDGIRKTHDNMRGIENSFSEIMKTIKFLKNIEEKTKNVNLRLSFTISPWNYRDLEKVIFLAKRLNTYIGIRFFQTSKHMYGNNTVLRELYIDKNLIFYVNKTLRKLGLNTFQKNIVFNLVFKRKLICTAFTNSLCITPDAYVKYCIYSEKLFMANKLDELWNSKQSKIIRKKMYNCNLCWTDCQSIPDIISLPYLLKIGKLY